MSVSADNPVVDSRVSEIAGSLDQCIIALDHIAVAVVSLREAVEWYTEKLGFELRGLRTTRGESTSMDSAVLQAGSAIVVLVQGNEPQSQVTKFVEEFGPGVQHVGFVVRDMDEAISRLRAAGDSQETEIMQEPGIRQVFLRRDCGSGVRVELIERRGGDFSDTSVERLFRAFESAAIY